MSPVRLTPGGYCIFDEEALKRLRLVRALFEAGIGAMHQLASILMTTLVSVLCLLPLAPRGWHGSAARR